MSENHHHHKEDNHVLKIVEMTDNDAEPGNNTSQEQQQQQTTTTTASTITSESSENENEGYVVNEPIESVKKRKQVTYQSSTDDQQHHQYVDTFEYYYENNEYYNEDYVKNANIRSISISKWPNVGFGFKLEKSQDKCYFCICEVITESPAESCLNSDDIIIELDEFDPYEKFNSLNDIETYLNSVDNIHLVVINKVDYDKFKKQDISLNNYTRNCEDIVIVSWNQLKQQENSV